VMPAAALARRACGCEGDRTVAPPGEKSWPWRGDPVQVFLMNRRHLLRSSAAVASSLLVPTRLLADLAPDNRYRREIGVQLYTLRNEIKKDAAGTIQAVADAGYHQGETYGFPNCDEMIAAARDSGLALNSSHIEWQSVTSPKDGDFGEFEKIVAKGQEVGLTHLVVPYLHDHERKTLDDYKRLAENMNKGAVLARTAGLQLAYHNHSFEFEPMEGGQSGFDIFQEEFAPEMQFELDVFWVKLGGVNPVEMIKGLSGRVSQLHLKDLLKGTDIPAWGGLPKEAFEELGDGMISMEPIIKAAAAAGVAHCHVEQDHSPNPLQSLKQSMGYLQGL